MPLHPQPQQSIKDVRKVFTVIWKAAPSMVCNEKDISHCLFYQLIPLLVAAGFNWCNCAAAGVWCNKQWWMLFWKHCFPMCVCTKEINAPGTLKVQCVSLYNKEADTQNTINWGKKTKQNKKLKHYSCKEQSELTGIQRVEDWCVGAGCCVTTQAALFQIGCKLDSVLEAK